MSRIALFFLVGASALALAQGFKSNLRMVLYPTAAQGGGNYAQPYSSFASNQGLPMWNSQYADILRREARASGSKRFLLLVPHANPEHLLRLARASVARLHDAFDARPTSSSERGYFPYYSGMGKGR